VKLTGKTIVVTGAASGIGKATADLAEQRGAKVIRTDIQDQPGVHKVDVTDHDAVQVFAKQILEEHGAVDGIFNVAGISTWGAIDKLDHKDWRALVEVNLMGPISMLEAFVPPMMERRQGGHVVNVSSAAGLIGLPWHAAYSASKFGLRGVSEVLRFDLKRYKIGVTLVCPGAVDTPLVGTVRVAGIDQEHPVWKKQSARFAKHAKTPEQVAKNICDGVEKNKYLVYTSPEIRAAFLLQRLLPPVYEQIMMLLNGRMEAMARATRQARR
jgi:NAD(P)-dependent dehydrogenase (short-subunit alcohol dehydrogenase family)